MTYGSNRRARVLAIAVLASACLFAAPAQVPREVDLTAQDFYLRPGFSLEWSYYEPDPADHAWTKVPAKPGNRPIIIRDIPLPGKRTISPFALEPGKAQKFCAVVVFDAAPELLESSSGIGLYMADIGKNWEIYLNGSPIVSEIFLNREGEIERERAVHGALVDIDKRFLKSGKNILTFVILGDAADYRTGLFAPGPYLIGEYQRLQRLKSEYLDLMLIGVYLFFALYHIILFLLRPANRQYLFYGLGTLAFAFYFLARSFIIFSFIADTALIRGLELSSLFILFPLFFAFFDICNRGKITPFTIGFGIISIVFALFAPFVWGELILKVWQTSLPLMLLYLAVADVILPVVGKLSDKEALRLPDRLRKIARSADTLTILIAFIIVAICVVAAFSDLNSNTAFVSAKIAAFLVIFGMAAVLASQFTSVFRDVEELTTGLEAKVNERTSALAGAMEEQSGLNASLQAANQVLQDTMDVAAKDMRIAVQVQQGIFPQSPPELEDWDIAFVSMPVSGVSGDFHDFYIEGGRLSGLVVGDVSGHGIASGLITVLARSIFWRCVHDLPAYSLGRIIEDINAELSAELSSVENYLTAILLRLDGNSIEYVNAGHTDLAFRRAGKARASYLVPSGSGGFKGPPLGREGISAPYHSVKFNVGKGDSLLLYTDCLIDARDESGVAFGTEDLLSAYGRAPADSAADMLEYILDDWKFHLGDSEVADDLTALLLKKK